MDKVINSSVPLKGEVRVAADKSISHRAVIFSGLARGKSVVRNFLGADDTLSTCRCMRELGIGIIQEGSSLLIEGHGLNGLKEPQGILDCGNSGTTMRLLSGLTAAQPFFSVLSGDSSLNNRPMKRVIAPLQAMGAHIEARNQGSYPPLAIKGTRLKGIEYHLPVASAQVKSALILAGLNAGSPTILVEPQQSRDHSERMLAAMGSEINIEGLTITVNPGCELYPQEFLVPADISSAAFFIVAAAIVPGSELLISNVGLNPTRTGIIEVMKSMGARIDIENERIIGGEPVADLVVKYADLNAVNINADIIPRLIDEIPVIAVAMAVARGTSTVRGAGELRVKETDRITAICNELIKMGVSIQEIEDGFIINGDPDNLKGNRVNSHGDHRIAMSLAIAAMRASGTTTIAGSEAVTISFPDFWPILYELNPMS